MLSRFKGVIKPNKGKSSTDADHRRQAQGQPQTNQPPNTKDSEPPQEASGPQAV